PAVDHGVHGLEVAVRQLRRLLGLAEVEAAGELADAHDVDPAGYALALYRGRGGKLGVEQAGPDVREEGEMLAQRKERGALRLLPGRKDLPLGPADRSEQDSVALLAQPQGAVRQGLAMPIDRRPAHVGRLGLQGEALLACDVAEHAKGLRHDLGSYVIAGEYRELEGGHGKRCIGIGWGRKGEGEYSPLRVRWKLLSLWRECPRSAR